MVAERSASASFDRCQATTRFTDSSACEETNPVSAIGDPHVTSVTGEKFDLWKTGWSLFVQIPKDIQPELVPGLFVAENVVPYDGDKCASSILQNVQISGLLDDGHEVWVRTGHLNGATPLGASFDGGEFKPIDAPSGSEIFTCPDLDVQESTLDDCNSEPIGTPALRSSWSACDSYETRHPQQRQHEQAARCEDPTTS